MFPITFTNQDFEGIDPDQDDPMIIMVDVAKYVVKKTLVDQGSSVDVLFWKTFKKLGLSSREIIPFDEQIISFSSD